MGKIPNAHVNFVTWELSEAMRVLSQQQADAIFRIAVTEGHIVDDPLAPYRLFVGDDKICSKALWVRKPGVSAKGKEIKPGWSHQPAFVNALQMAKRLARQRRAGAMQSAMDEAAELAQEASPDVIREMVQIARNQDEDGNQREVKESDQVRAGALVWKIASDTANESESDSEIANDWWGAADETE